jgi:hypothetical protein
MISSTVRDLLRAADTQGAKIDPKLRKSLETATGLLSEVNTITVDGPDLGTAIADALLDGRDVASDPAVIRAIVGTHITSPGGLAAVRERTTARLWTLLRDNLDNLITPFQAPLEKAADTFTQAHAILSAHNIGSITDPAIATAPLKVAEAGIEARKAQADITAIRSAIDGLLVMVGRADGSPLGHLTRWVDAGNAPAPQILELGRAATEWDVVSHGYRISIATPAENAERRERATHAEQAVNFEASRDHAQEARAAAMARR